MKSNGAKPLFHTNTEFTLEDCGQILQGYKFSLDCWRVLSPMLARYMIEGNWLTQIKLAVEFAQAKFFLMATSLQWPRAHGHNLGGGANVTVSQ